MPGKRLVSRVGIVPAHLWLPNTEGQGEIDVKNGYVRAY